ncbi:uncharacterized protein F5Z01DRAFT_332124 [Emericellopsis atlantica]|uniref:Zn(2)-C6 fungal-type domain-containing protein n=1 Tax=Emericellopsis atlantica TaxID=2614577 RepID=A0A9P8CLI2_9HYPO|nr:uncharacterized protein F5Z01DRAFT_332124 [Emericellopsis atlantica]KAG9251097.1 hypothetical protein F5Z01DRAFT_332124 [Emericellopsis atlantica]
MRLVRLSCRPRIAFSSAFLSPQEHELSVAHSPPPFSRSQSLIPQILHQTSMSQLTPTSRTSIDPTSPAADAPRTKKACDLCRSRKVKCRVADNERICEGCRDLGVSCTYARPRRRRGPPNRHVQGPAPTKLDDGLGHPGSPATREPGVSPTGNGHPARSLKNILASLGPSHLILELLDDWFRFVHPLAPILHRQHLLHRLHSEESENDQVFAALVISVCAVTISTLRRKSFESYPGITFDKCIEIIEQGNLLQSQPISLDYCIAWYHVASAVEVDAGTGNYRSYRAIREAMTGVDWLLCYAGDEQPAPDKERLKRLYWLLFMWQVGSEIQGQPHLAFVPFNQKLEHLRPMNITDSQLYPDLASSADTPSWPEDEIHFIPGLNSLIDVFLTWEQSKKDLTHKQPEETLKCAISRIQHILDNLPPDLRWTGGLTRFPQPVWGHKAQMVNILITALSLKSNFLQHLGSLLPGLSHYDIICDVLEILQHLPQPVFEVNGHSLVVKIRDIGAAYLSELSQESRGGVEYNERHAKVHQVLQALKNLDFRPHPDAGDPIASTVETE